MDGGLWLSIDAYLNSMFAVWLLVLLTEEEALGGLVASMLSVGDNKVSSLFI